MKRISSIVFVLVVTLSLVLAACQQKPADRKSVV